MGVLFSFLLGMIITNSFDLQYATTIPTPWQVAVFWRIMLGVPVIPSIIQLILIAIGFIP
jgi:hypothetical protein